MVTSQLERKPFTRRGGCRDRMECLGRGISPKATGLNRLARAGMYVRVHVHSTCAHAHTHTDLKAPLGQPLDWSPTLMGNRSCPPPPAPTAAFLLPLSTTALPFPRRLLYRSQVPIRALEVWAALEDMTWGPDNVRKWSTLALLAIMGTALTAATDPGFVAMISQKGLDFGNWMPFFLLLLP